MRDYGKLSPFFWTRGSGKRLRGDPEAQVVAAYLSTSPSANMIGIYYVALVTISNDTGVALEKVREALGRIEKAGYAFYDFEAELVWIPNHARFEVGSSMSSGDKRRKRLLVELTQVGDHRFANDFVEVYGDSFGISHVSPPSSRPPSWEGASGMTEGASADREPIQSNPIQSNPSRESTREEGASLFLDLETPLEADARDLWTTKAANAALTGPVELVWENFRGHYAGQSFGSRTAILGRWSKWLNTQIGIDRKAREQARERADRQAKFDRERAAPRVVEVSPQPYHQVVRPPKSEPRASPTEQAEAMRRISEMFKPGKTGS